MPAPGQPRGRRAPARPRRPAAAGRYGACCGPPGSLEAGPWRGRDVCRPGGRAVAGLSRGGDAACACSESIRCSMTRPPRWSSTARWSRRPRKSASAAASTASARCRSPPGSSRGRPRAWCLAHAGLRPDEVDLIGFSYDPALARPAAELGLDDPWDHLRITYAEQAPGFLADALPGLDPQPGPVRAAPRRARRLRRPGRAAARRQRAGLRRPRRAGLAPGRLVPGRQAGGAVYPAAAALAGPDVRGAHHAPGLPALQRRVQGDGAGLLRQATVPGPDPGQRGHRPTAASAPSRSTGPSWRRRGRRPRTWPPRTPTWRPAPSAAWRKCCSALAGGCTSRPATRPWPWPAAPR